MTPTIGSIVHVVVDNSECRAAIVVRVLTPDSINVHLFDDGPNDDGLPVVEAARENDGRLKSLKYARNDKIVNGESVSEGPSIASWHWPEEDA